MDSGIQLDPKSFLLLVTLLMALNTYRLYDKRRRGELANYEGEESPVTAFDVWLSAALSVISFAALAHQWWLGRN